MVQFINIEKDVSEFVRNLEEIFCFVQVLGKIAVVTFRSYDFMRLVENTKEFWSFNKCNQQTKAEMNSIQLFIIRLQKIFAWTFLIAGLLVMGVPLLERTHAVGIWTLEGHEMLYNYVMVGQPIVIPFSGIMVGALDCMYLGFCAEIVIQFKLVNRFLEELTAGGSNYHSMQENYLNKMRICIHHHKLLLWFVKDFRETFSSIFLLEYFTVGPLACVELFAALESFSFQTQMRHATIFMVVIIQLSFYCIPANYISNEALAVSDAVYFSGWYSPYFPSLKTPLLLMVQNSQAGITIKAGGLITINAQTLVTILKVAWSACSLARGLKQN
ncbi:hypothetical protein ILUMI_20216 [Ignelater luminosus]|uniref:Odorant receptor n=1 Tax=Ignelater luminosus TaxID=2038154 RepID=A0A8K0G533_IGNLU|nr:hypothetical protein ILUMI_20216 [Ignelater luminosus]